MTNDADRDDREHGRNRQPPRRDGSPSAEAILTALSNGIAVLDAQRSPDGVPPVGTCPGPERPRAAPEHGPGGAVHPHPPMAREPGTPAVQFNGGAEGGG